MLAHRNRADMIADQINSITAYAFFVIVHFSGFRACYLDRNDALLSKTKFLINLKPFGFAQPI